MTVCQHVNRVLSLLFSVLPFFSSYVVTDRRQAAQQHGWFFWGFFVFFFSELWGPWQAWDGAGGRR